AQDIVRGGTASFTWTLVEDGTAAGSLQLGTRARGSDVNSPSTPIVSSLASTGATVQEPGRLSLSKMSVPATVSRGQTFTVSVVMTGTAVNSGTTVSASATPASATVQRPAALSIGSLTLASSTGGSSVDRGQAFTAKLVVRNDGEAIASNVLPSPPVPALL